MGRDPAFLTPEWRDSYWASAVGWHQVLSDAGFATDVLYDAHWTKKKLSLFPVLLMPLAVAISDSQWKILLNYIQAGGKLMTGPWFGLCDEWGETRSLPVGLREGFPFGDRFPDWEQIHEPARVDVMARGRRLDRSAAPLSALLEGDRRIELMPRARSRTWRRTIVGKGEIVQCAY
ncbi:MAG: beta-galactosidase trimerization domain-containing protein, partial [Kiritimatiellia bacterium]|nr:beta-galactosidase trimerization domain-containing protein [Kiritimatiellia bacterium]